MSRLSDNTPSLKLALALALILPGMAAAQQSGAQAAAFARLAPADAGPLGTETPLSSQPGAPKAAAPASKWIGTSMPWFLLPSGDTLGPLPKTIAIRPVAWNYAARSERVDVFGKAQPSILRVTLQVRSGSVGVVLSSPDGSALVSKEAALRPSPADAEVYFRVRSGSPPSLILIRNYDGAGESGSVVLKGVQFVREGDLTNEELSTVVQKGLY